MKLLVIHDTAGNIHSAVAPSAEAQGRATLVAGSGQRVTEIDTDAVPAPAPRDRDPEADDLTVLVEHIIRAHRVRDGRLTPRER